METQKLLKTRSDTHGYFADNAVFIRRMHDVLRTTPNYCDLDPVKKLAVFMMMLKLSRALCGNPDHRDHWVDIQGYAKLAEDSCSDE